MQQEQREKLYKYVIQEPASDFNPFAFKHLIHIQRPDQNKEEKRMAKGYKSTILQCSF